MTGHIKMKNTKMLEQLQNQIEKWYKEAKWISLTQIHDL
jgi:hypothetical protein